MVEAVSYTPVLLFRLYLDTGTLNKAASGFTYNSVAYTAGIAKGGWGSIDRSCSIPPGGLFQVGDAVVSLEDTSEELRAAIDAVTPIRRIGEILVANSSVDSPPVPLYRGELVPEGTCLNAGVLQVTLRDVGAAQLNRQIPSLITRANYPNLPDGVDAGFAPIVFGIVESATIANVAKQGAMECPLVDTAARLYMVARHTCNEVITVYRRRTNDDFFLLVDESEWQMVNDVRTIDGVVYTTTCIQFFVQQTDGAVIRADVSGAVTRPAFGVGGGGSFYGLDAVTGELRNRVDAIILLILTMEQRGDRYDIDSFIETRARCDAEDIPADFVIDSERTLGEAIAPICRDAGIHLRQNNAGQIGLKYRSFVTIDEGGPNEVLGDVPYAIDNMLTSKRSVKTDLPAETFSRFRPRYAENYGMTGPAEAHFTLNKKGKRFLSGQWGYEHTLDNLDDQDEAALGAMVTFTANATSNVMTAARTGFTDGQLVHVRNVGGALPGGLSAATDYYTRDCSGLTFKLESSPGGGAIDLTTAGSGRNYVGVPDPIDFIEKVWEFPTVRDPDLADRLMRDIAGYYTNRSNTLAAELPTAEVFGALMIQLGGSIEVTHETGFGSNGYVGAGFVIHGVTYDVGGLRLNIRGTRHIPRDEINFLSTWDSGEGMPASSPQTRKPDLLLTVNDDLSALLKRVNFSSTSPPAPPGFQNVVIAVADAGERRQIALHAPDGGGSGPWVDDAAGHVRLVNESNFVGIGGLPVHHLHVMSAEDTRVVISAADDFAEIDLDNTVAEVVWRIRNDPFNGNRLAINAFDYGAVDDFDVARFYGDNGEVEFPAYSAATPNVAMWTAGGIFRKMITADGDVFEAHFDATHLVVPAASSFADEGFVAGIGCAAPDGFSTDTALVLGANSFDCVFVIDPAIFSSGVDSSASGYLTPFWPYIKSGGSGPTFPDGDGYLNMVLWPAFGGFPADFWVYGSFATPPD